MKQLDYMKRVADDHLNVFYEHGHAVPGNNGPYKQQETPVRNTGHYLIIYSYLFKITGKKQYADISHVFANYLINEQKKTQSGAVQCMYDDGFDRINGLIGQAWTIEALLYYSSVFSDERSVDTARKIFYSQRYSYDLHTWIRTDIDGKELGADLAYNHSVWFAACSLPLLDHDPESKFASMLDDFMLEGVKRDFRIYGNGLLKHLVAHAPTNGISIKYAIKKILYPFRKISPRKLDVRYGEQGYHLFDMYGFCILYSFFPEYPLFCSDEFKRAVDYALNIDALNREMYVNDYLSTGNPHFNVFGWSYNSPGFEFPFVEHCFNKSVGHNYDSLFDIQTKLMFDVKTNRMSRNNPDIETFEARSYEIIRYLEQVG